MENNLLDLLTNFPSDTFHRLWPRKSFDILGIFVCIAYCSCRTDKLVSMLVRHLKEDMDQVLKRNINIFELFKDVSLDFFLLHNDTFVWVVIEFCKRTLALKDMIEISSTYCIIENVLYILRHITKAFML